MPETFFQEMKRYVGFGPGDEDALRRFHPLAAPHFRRIAEEFYDRLARHEGAMAVFSGPEQIQRLKGTLCDWMELLFTGPWDEAYYEKRARIGRMHVRISLPQRYMFGAMDAIRLSFAEIANGAYGDPGERIGVVMALHKVLDLELAIMLETYGESFVDKVQQLERLEKTLLERRLAISEARYAEIVETAGALVVAFDARGVVQFANRQCRELLGEEARGRDFFAVFVAADRRDVVRQQVERMIREGSHVPVFETPVAAKARERRVRWYLTSLPSQAETLVSAVGIDVTEEHALATRTRRAERLASLGTMAAGLAHEIRNPLNAAHLQLTLLQRRLSRAGDVAGATQAADLAAREMKRLAGLVEEFLQFARPQPLRIAAADLRATAEVIVSLVRPYAEEQGVALELVAPGEVLIEMDDEKIKQVLHNLVRNAIEASPRGSRVRVTVTRNAEHAALEVQDEGKGIEPPDAPIFEPFYTSKSEGTGLGLAIALRIVTDHGGRIDVQSQAGRTVFTVVLPLDQGTQVLRVG